MDALQPGCPPDYRYGSARPAARTDEKPSDPKGQWPATTTTVKKETEPARADHHYKRCRRPSRAALSALQLSALCLVARPLGALHYRHYECTGPGHRHSA